MAHKQEEIKRVVRKELERLGFTGLEFGFTPGSSHQYALVRVNGVQRKFTFSLTPSIINEGKIRSAVRWRLREWGWQGKAALN
jgi:hypothetical protein